MSNYPGYEIDFLPVGSGEKSGDAIAVRWIDGSEYKVLIYDGGTRDSGQKLVDHVKTYYGTNRVDYVVNSHPDSDHASGLSVVLDQLHVGQVWMHRPWDYSSVIRQYFDDRRLTDQSLEDRLRAKMSAAHVLEEQALRKGIPVYEPFQGQQIGPFTVLSPDKQWYVHDLICAFEKSPKQKQVDSALDQVMKAFTDGLTKIANFLADHWHADSLREHVETSAENESSVILLGNFNGRGVLLTGDAGIQALARAANYAARLGYDLPSFLNFVQIPHHGSRNNVSPSVLDSIVGQIKPMNDGVATKWAFASAAQGSTAHPKKMVTNAFVRRGAKVKATQGTSIRHSIGMPVRNWGPIEPLPFFNEVEPWSD